MDATTLLATLCTTIDERRWDDLPDLLHADFTCRLVHTGETFDRDAWVRLNREYPGFDRLVVADLLGSTDRAAARCHVTGHVEGELVHFEVASLVTVRDDLISELTEVWADVGATAPEGTRPVRGDSAPPQPSP